jgi:hypothetical protein
VAIPNQLCPEGREQIRRKEAQEDAKTEAFPPRTDGGVA